MLMPHSYRWRGQDYGPGWGGQSWCKGLKAGIVWVKWKWTHTESLVLLSTAFSSPVSLWPLSCLLSFCSILISYSYCCRTSYEDDSSHSACIDQTLRPSHAIKRGGISFTYHTSRKPNKTRRRRGEKRITWSKGVGEMITTARYKRHAHHWLQDKVATSLFSGCHGTGQDQRCI